MYCQIPMGRKQRRECLSVEHELTELACGKAVQEAYSKLTSEFTGVGATECELDVADSLWRHVQAEQR